MIIANPLYDVVFKYLLEDGEIARELLSIILEEVVQSPEVKPQETTAKISGDIRILRFDFKAVIKKSDEERSVVLIERQKAKHAFNVMRFRRYLGENYRREDAIINHEGKPEVLPLPIITIYFLGFNLNNIPAGVVKINREYRDLVTRKILDIKDDFVELLTHETYLIQVPGLPTQARNKLEQVLHRFRPIYQTAEDRHKLIFQGDTENPLGQKKVNRLEGVLTSDEMKEQMEVEDEINRLIEREMAKRDKLIAEKDLLLQKERKRAKEARNRGAEERKRAEEARK